MRRLLLVAVLGWILVLSTHCAQPPIDDGLDDPRASEDDPAHTVYVIRHAWHAGLALRTDALNADDWPFLDDFESHTYVEVGWGDAGYYPDPNPGLGALLRAGAWPTDSVLHVALFDEPVEEAFPRHDIVAIPVSNEAVQQLVSFVQHTLTDPPGDQVAQGHYHTSAFYPARLPYHVFNNCNHWAAAALQSMGCDMYPAGTLRVERLLDDAADCGRWLHSAP